MEANQLAQKMLEYAAYQARADALETEIKAAVMELGKTQTVGIVKATYREARKFYDYRKGAQQGNADHVDIEKHTRVTEKTDWRGLCADIGVEDIPFTIGKPSVSVKID